MDDKLLYYDSFILVAGELLTQSSLAQALLLIPLPRKLSGGNYYFATRHGKGEDVQRSRIWLPDTLFIGK